MLNLRAEIVYILLLRTVNFIILREKKWKTEWIEAYFTCLIKIITHACKLVKQTLFDFVYFIKIDRDIRYFMWH